MAHYSADNPIYAGGGFTVRVDAHDTAIITHTRWPAPYTVPGEFAGSIIVGNTLYVMHIDHPKTHTPQISKFTYAGSQDVIWCNVLAEYNQTIHGDIYQFPQGSLAITADERPVITSRLRNYVYGNRLHSYDDKTVAYHWCPPRNTFIACDTCRVHLVTVDDPWQVFAQFNNPRLERYNILLKRRQSRVPHSIWESKSWTSYLGIFYTHQFRSAWRGETTVPTNAVDPVKIGTPEGEFTLTYQYTPWLWQLFTDRETLFASTPDDILRLIGEFVQEPFATITGDTIVNLDEIY